MEPVKKSGKSKGGIALSEKMTPEEKKAKAMAMVEAKRARKNMEQASHRGEIKIGDIVIPCAVLEGGTRVISENAIHSNLGTSGGKVRKIRSDMEKTTGAPVPLFLASKALEPFIHQVFGDGHLEPISYINNGIVSSGYDAGILPKVCEVWLKAKDAGMLQGSQLPKAKKAEVLMRGLAHIGIIALIDEATGYQKDRAKNELAKILEAFVAKELQPYMKTFPSDFYEQLFRLRGLPYPPENPRFKPQYFGLLTNDIVYERIAPGLLEELKRQSRKDEKKAHLHRRLTAEIGHPKLREHLAAVVMAMKLSTDYADFISKLNQFYPRFGDTYQLGLDAEDLG